MKNQLSLNYSESKFYYGVLQVVLAAAIWGAAYPLTKDALRNISPLFLGFCRFFLAGILLMAYSKSMPLENIEKKDRWAVISMAFWGTFLLVIAMNLGLSRAPGVVASVLSGTPPLFTVVLAAFWLKEPMERRHFAAVVLSISGIFLLSNNYVDENISGGMLTGVALLLLAQISWAVYGILGKEAISRYTWLQICRDTFSLGALMLAPVALAELIIKGPGIWNIQGYLTLAYLGIGNSIITYGLWNNALRVIPVSTASFVLYLQPISGAILSVIIYGETLSAQSISGCILIFIGLSIVLKK
ncbi:MAG: EamA family transporter [Candidatus Riflebacteria bacterium]|nr:EamA family transporter [Candidatus Riflebacteria bacterium]